MKKTVKIDCLFLYVVNTTFKRKRAENYGRFLKMIDNLQTPKHKTNLKYRSCSTLYFLSLIDSKCNEFGLLLSEPEAIYEKTIDDSKFYDN